LDLASCPASTYPVASAPQASSARNVTRGPKKTAVTAINSSLSPTGKVTTCSPMRLADRGNSRPDGRGAQS
jgi:hypothetical protein